MGDRPIDSALMEGGGSTFVRQDELDPEFLQWITDFPRDVVPEIEQHLRAFDKTIIRFHSREDADEFIESLK